MDEQTMDAFDQRLSDAAWEAERAYHYAQYRRATPAERQRVITGREPNWYCPFCGRDYGSDPDPFPAAIACCGELGRLEQRADDEA